MVTQETITVEVSITALDPDESFDKDDFMLELSEHISNGWTDDGYVVTVSNPKIASS